MNRATFFRALAAAAGAIGLGRWTELGDVVPDPAFTGARHIRVSAANATERSERVVFREWSMAGDPSDPNAVWHRMPDDATSLTDVDGLEPGGTPGRGGVGVTMPETPRPMVPIGTHVQPWGKVAAIGVIEGERYYWLVKGEAVSMAWAISDEAYEALSAEERRLFHETVPTDDEFAEWLKEEGIELRNLRRLNASP